MHLCLAGSQRESNNFGHKELWNTVTFWVTLNNLLCPARDIYYFLIKINLEVTLNFRHEQAQQVFASQGVLISVCFSFSRLI